MQNEIKNIYEYTLEECARGLKKLGQELREKKYGKEELRKKKYGKEEYKNMMADLIVNTTNEKANNIVERNTKYISKLEESLRKLDKEVIIVDMETKTRCLINMSSPFAWLVDEVGLEWDPILDTPYIPATEIKGVVSATLQFEDEILRDLLGSSGETVYKSLVDFTNAYPIGFSEGNNNNLLERDTFTPMYGEKNIEEHKASPVPVHFVTIAPKVRFRFLIIIDKPRLQSLLKLLSKPEKSLSENEKKLVRKLEVLIKKLGANPNSPDDVLSKMKKKMLESVKEGFEKMGVGAKTSSGYGRFRIYGR